MDRDDICCAVAGVALKRNMRFACADAHVVLVEELALRLRCKVIGVGDPDACE